MSICILLAFLLQLICCQAQPIPSRCTAKLSAVLLLLFVESQNSRLYSIFYTCGPSIMSRTDASALILREGIFFRKPYFFSFLLLVSLETKLGKSVNL